MLKTYIISALLLCSFVGTAQETIKTMFYNLLEFPSANPSNRQDILQEILTEYGPDIFMVCELESQSGGDLILNTSLNSNGDLYEQAPYIPNQSSGANLQQMLFYRGDKFDLELTEVILTDVRDINHYRLKLNTVDQGSDPIFIELYVAHLKSSQGSSNVAERLDMVTDFTSTLDQLDPNSYVLFAGDFNVYTATEPAYQELFNPDNAIVFADPIDTPGAWNNNISFQGVHTQSTRISSGGFGAGAGGGLDDRFDFIMVSENMMTDPTMRYIPDTYQSYGNNGNCYNNDINDSDCDGVFDQDIRNLLYNMSDHLPVVMSLETDKTFVLGTQDLETSAAFELLHTVVTTGELKIKVAPQHLGRSTFRIYNMLGQQVREFNDIENEQSTLSLQGLSPGIYVIKSTIPNSSPVKFLKVS
jgi:hypothetical protein